MVKVLPEPVTPSSTWSRSWARTPFTSSSIACGWSPFGSNSDTTRNAPPALGLVRPRRPVRQPRRPVADVGVALFQERFERIGRDRRAGQAARMAFREGRLELGLRRFAEPLRLGLDQSGVEQLGEMLAERMDLGPRGLGLWSGRLRSRLGPGRLGPGGGFSGGGHGRNMGRIHGPGEGRAQELRRLDWIEAGAPVLLSTRYGASCGRGRLRRAVHHLRRFLG